MVPHPPQLLRSFVVSEHVPLHAVRPAGHPQVLAAHTPPTSGGQTMSHAPQLFRSFVRLRHEPLHIVSPAAHVHAIQTRLAFVRQREDQSARRLLEPGHIEDHAGGDARLHGTDAIDLPEALCDRLRRALEQREDVGEAIGLVVRALRREQRLVRAAHGDVRGHRGGDDERDRECLSAHVPQIAQELPVQHHHDSSSGEILCAFDRTSTIVPLPIRITRSAIPAIAALWVMTAVVVPRSRLMSCRTLSTSFPVS